MCQCTVLLKDNIIIRNVFGGYQHFVKMVEHLNNAIYWHAIHAWWRKTLNAFFPILILFGAHILSFRQWIVV